MLEETRKKIRAIDSRIAELIAERLKLAQSVGEEKERLGLPIRDYATEKRVHEAMRGHAERLQIDPAVIRDVTAALIRGAVALQASRRKAPPLEGEQRSVVVGGAGHMGRWFAGYLGSRGYGVQSIEKGESLDPARDADLVIVSVPLAATAAMLDEIAQLQPSGIVLEISSLKTPLQGRVPGWLESGMKFAAIHPMFGAEADLLSGRNLIICEAGCPEAEEAAMDLFRESALHILHLPLAEHDRMMTWVLNLPHLVNLIAADLLAGSEVPLDQLHGMGGTTFQKQEAVTSEVVEENPELYYQIQALNAHTPELIERTLASLEWLSDEVRQANSGGFVERMETWKRYFESGTSGGDSA